MLTLRRLLRLDRERHDVSQGESGSKEAAAGRDTLRATGAIWTLTGSNSGRVSNLTGTFTGMANLHDTSGGTLEAPGATWTLTGPDSGTTSNLSGTFAGMTKVIDPDKKNGDA